MHEPAASVSTIVGWDVGGAHVKACLVHDGAVRDVVQWPCPLWMGLQHLEAALAQVRARWPHAWDGAARHAATMTGEMADLFATRQDGVLRLSALLAERLGPSLRLYGAAHGWIAPQAAARHWEAIASANWHATAQWVAGWVGRAGQVGQAGLAGRSESAGLPPDAVLLDIGSTTTDVIPLRHGRVVAGGLTDADRLASGELVYQGVVRTPLCALGQRLPFDGRTTGVMNELFATTADVYRLTGELDPAHDQQPAADQGAKDREATCQRLARMIGRDAREASFAQWLALAHAWRDAQRDQIGARLADVAAQAGLARDAAIVGAGCGDFLAAELAARAGRPYRRFADTVSLPGALDVAGKAAALGKAGAADEAVADRGKAAAGRAAASGANVASGVSTASGASMASGAGMASAASAANGLARWAQVCAPAVAVALLAAGG